VIEEAASVLFAERGYSETRLEDIALAAGVTKQLVYQHFASKKELHLALLAAHRDGLLGTLARGMGAEGPLLERIPQATDAWFGYVEDHPYASAMLFRDTTGDPAVQAFYRELQTSARMAIVSLLEAEPELEIAAGRAEPLAEFIRSAIVGLALWRADHPDVPRSEVVDVAVSVLTHGLVAGGGSRSSRG
jgi:AcrR family transcriptional regulator